MAQDSGSGSELTASSPSVTILTDGLPGPAGIAARGHDDARVIPVADAMSEGLPSDAIVAVSDTNTVVAVLDLFQSTAAPGAVIRLVMVDSLGVRSPDLLAALALFDVTTIDTRAACPILTLRTTGERARIRRAVESTVEPGAGHGRGHGPAVARTASGTPR